MTEELQRALEERLREAEASDDQSRVLKAISAVAVHTMDCQRKMSDRVKVAIAWMERNRDIGDKLDRLTDVLNRHIEIAGRREEYARGREDGRIQAFGVLSFAVKHILPNAATGGAVYAIVRLCGGV